MQKISTGIITGRGKARERSRCWHGCLESQRSSPGCNLSFQPEDVAYNETTGVVLTIEVLPSGDIVCIALLDGRDSTVVVYLAFLAL